MSRAIDLAAMTVELLLRALSLCVALASVETLHGIARTVFLAPRLGKALAIKVSIVSGSLLAFTVCYLFVPGMGLTSLSSLLILGICLALFMASFDIALGLWLLRRSWRKALSDLDPRTGNLLIVGLSLLVFMPLLVMRLQSSGT